MASYLYFTFHMGVEALHRDREGWIRTSLEDRMGNLLTQYTKNLRTSAMTWR